MGSPKFAVSAREIVKNKSPGLEASSDSSGLCACGLPEPKRLQRQTTTKNSLSPSPLHRGRGVWAAVWLDPPPARKDGFLKRLLPISLCASRALEL